MDKYLKTADTEWYKQRIAGVIICVLVAFVVLFIRLIYLQVMKPKFATKHSLHGGHRPGVNTLPSDARCGIHKDGFLCCFLDLGKQHPHGNTRGSDMMAAARDMYELSPKTEFVHIPIQTATVANTVTSLVNGCAVLLSAVSPSSHGCAAFFLADRHTNSRIIVTAMSSTMQLRRPASFAS